VPQSATGSDVLAKVATPKEDKSGLICAIDTFGPCAAAAPAATPSSPAAKKKDSGSTALSVGIGVVLVLAAGGSMVALRRRTGQ
jgi:hypothetical protein